MANPVIKIKRGNDVPSSMSSLSLVKGELYFDYAHNDLYAGTGDTGNTSVKIGGDDAVYDASYNHTDNNFTAALKNQIGTNESNISSLQSSVSALQGDVTSLGSRVTALETTVDAGNYNSTS